MKELVDFKEEIHRCSRCGICQGVCPIYQATGNDCSVSRGQFVMLKGILDGKLTLSKTVNRYLDLCLKCGKCTSACPSGVNPVDVIIAAKYEYFKSHPIEKLISFIQKYFIFGLGVKILSYFNRRTKSKKFDKKVLYFGGCGSKVKGDKTIVQILNSIGIEVINPKYHCCGIYMLTRGDLKGFNNYIKSFVEITQKYGINEIVTNCVSCEKTLKDYIRWAEDKDIKEFLKGIKIKNIYEYLKENNLQLSLKKTTKVTYHKPCHLENFDDVKWILNNTKNLEYVEMPEYDSCCGLNGITKIREYNTMKKVFNKKYKNILSTNVKYILTSCVGCEAALTLYSKGKYRVYDLLQFIQTRL
ncbi:MAG: (Fe-S)-binding protein [bacterium]|nr:(Fe-S)-binding protein [bacterium]